MINQTKRFITYITYILLISTFGNCKNLRKLEDGKSPDCGEELCIPGYEICLESRCRNCKDFLNTQYGCQNVNTLKECAALCIDETERRLNFTIMTLKKRLKIRTFTIAENRTLGSNKDAIHENGSLVLFFIVGMVVGGCLGFVVTFGILRYNRSRIRNNESEDRLPSQPPIEAVMRDPRLSQIPASGQHHTEDSQRLIAQETNILCEPSNQ